MLKKVLKLESAQGLSKDEQKEIFGGFGPTAGGVPACATVCPTAAFGVRCRFHPLCPLADGMCNGQGGYIPL